MPIGCPMSDRPMRRLKNRSSIRSVPWLLTVNWPEFSRKKSRFSGKNSGNRVRFTCCSSTSACAKSVLTVTSSAEPGLQPVLHVEADVAQTVADDAACRVHRDVRRR